MIPLNKIIDFFKDYEFNNSVIELSDCEKVIDMGKFVKTSISYLLNNKGKKLYMPYYERLVKIYLKLNTNEKTKL